MKTKLQLKKFEGLTQKSTKERLLGSIINKFSSKLLKNIGSQYGIHVQVAEDKYTLEHEDTVITLQKEFAERVLQAITTLDTNFLLLEELDGNWEILDGELEDVTSVFISIINDSSNNNLSNNTFALRFAVLLLTNVFQSVGISINNSEHGKVCLIHHDFEIELEREYLIQLAGAVLLGKGDLCFGEGFMEHKWSVTKGSLVDVLIAAFNIWNNEKLMPVFHRLQEVNFSHSQKNTPDKSKDNVAQHYDLGNTLYKHFLDVEMNYSAGIFDLTGFEPEKLNDAQVRKNLLLLDVLDVSSESKVLEIGCGWGGLSRLIIEHSHEVTGISLSEEQIDFCQNNSSKVSNNSNLKYKLQDYRDYCQDHIGQHDRIVSVEMFDHVGKDHHVEFFRNAHMALSEDGVLVMQILVRPQAGTTSQWIDKYIFPGAYIASFLEVQEAFSEVGFSLDHENSMHYSGLHYAATLQAWLDSFQENWQHIRCSGYDDKFYRMWTYYLSASKMVFEKGGFYTMHLRLIKDKSKDD